MGCKQCDDAPTTIGQMRTECLVESPITQDDGAGGQIVTWGAPSFQCFARITEGKGWKKLLNEQLTLVRWTKMVTWYNPAFTETMRVTFNGRVCRILDIQNWNELEQYSILTLQDGEGT